MSELERGAVEHLVVVDAELTGQLGLVEECLLVPLACPGASVGGRQVPAAPLPERVSALAALRRVRKAVSSAGASGPRVWAPNGRWEHVGLRLAVLRAADVDLLYAVLRELSGALVAPVASGSDPGAAGASSPVSTTGRGLSTLLAELAAAAGVTPAGLVGALARTLAAVDLVPDADTTVLTHALQAADGDEVRLTAGQEVAWQRLAHRVTMVLTESAPLHRFLD